MAPNELLAAVRRRPFRAFRLHLSDGSSYEVRHPETFLVGNRTSVLGLTREGAREPIADRYVYVDTLHITQLEELDTAAQSA
jgi:hypothetical protein